MKVFLVTLLLAVVGHQVASQSCHLREIDLCIATVLLHAQGSGLPVEEDDIDGLCEAVEETHNCIGNYTQKCMTPLQRELISMMTEGAISLRQDFCSPSELRAEYLKHASCISEILDSDDNKDCVRDFQAGIEVVPEVKFDKRLPAFCCGFERLMNCIHEPMEEKCGKKAVSIATTILQMAVSDLPYKVCGSYDPKGEECTNLLPPKGTAPLGAKSKSSLSKLMSAYTGE